MWNQESQSWHSEEFWLVLTHMKQTPQVSAEATTGVLGVSFPPLSLFLLSIFPLHQTYFSHCSSITRSVYSVKFTITLGTWEWRNCVTATLATLDKGKQGNSDDDHGLDLVLFLVTFSAFHCFVGRLLSKHKRNMSPNLTPKFSRI